jgi:hypothetical protein
MKTCQPTPCQQCKMCYAAVKSFTTLHAQETDPVALARAFRVDCGKVMGPTACSKAAVLIEASPLGAFGKRPMALCKALQLCTQADNPSTCVIVANTSTTDVAVTTSNADACTTDGKPYAAGGALVPSRPGVTFAAESDGESCFSATIAPLFSNRYSVLYCTVLHC